jgi:hypothetical protein
MLFLSVFSSKIFIDCLNLTFFLSRPWRDIMKTSRLFGNNEDNMERDVKNDEAKSNGW